MTLFGKHKIRSKVVTSNKIIEEFGKFSYIGCDMSNKCDRDLSYHISEHLMHSKIFKKQNCKYVKYSDIIM
jgi:hypothetical protein